MTGLTPSKPVMDAIKAFIDAFLDLPDAPPVPPPCAWCSEPSAEQVHMGNSLRGTTWVPRYSWLCSTCAREAWQERELSRSQ